MDAARNYLFPVYASLLTPWWLRLLGARIGKDTEISTALLIPGSPSSSAHSWPTTPWWGPTNWAAAGSTSARQPSASAHSWATPGSPARPPGAG